MDKKITPVLIGADLNCYNIARAFHEYYGVRSSAFGRYKISATQYSKLIDFTVIPDLDSKERLLQILQDFSKKHEGEKLVAFGCTDDYAILLSSLKKKLPEYIIPYPDYETGDRVSRKADFYSICEKYGIPYPSTVIIERESWDGKLQELPFEFPVIVKPSSSVEYWKHPFDGMKKVYSAKSRQEAEEIVESIFSSGYGEKIIIQEMIDGGDSQMRVFTAFSDSSGRVRAMCLGHTMLEEHTPKGLGNHAAIVTEKISDFPLAMKLKSMLEDMKYTGFSNFDIKLRKGTKDDFKVFEINLRQGRSNYYVTAAGINLAFLASEIFEDTEGEDTFFCENSIFWHHVPKKVAYDYTEDRELVATARKLASEGKESSSVWYRHDLRNNPLRLVCVCEMMRRQKKKYALYQVKP